MTQNTSSAVMAQRHEPPDALDDFPTPEWGTRALTWFLRDSFGYRISEQDVWEPAANRGHMVRPLSEAFRHAHATDAHDYGCGYGVRDFLWPGDELRHDWIITNPPFRLATDFALTAIERARVGVALLMRSVWTEGCDRYERIFSQRAPTWQLQFSERLPMVRGRVGSKVTTATAYSWFVWDVRAARGTPTTLIWIPPGTRRTFERPGDYDDPSMRGAA